MLYTDRFHPGNRLIHPPGESYGGIQYHGTPAGINLQFRSSIDKRKTHKYLHTHLHTYTHMHRAHTCTVHIHLQTRAVKSLCYVMLCYVMLCYVMSCHVMSCHVMLCSIVLCCVVLCCVFQFNFLSRPLPS